MALSDSERDAELVSLRSEVADVAGQVSHLQRQVDHLDSRIDVKLDALLGIKAKHDDNTARILMIEEKVQRSIALRDRIAWVYAGAVTAAAAAAGLLHLIGRL